MGQSMRILIAYDGSECAINAIEDLRRAGLPRNADVLVFAVDEILMPPPSSYEFAALPNHAELLPRLRKAVARSYERASQSLLAKRDLAHEGSHRLRSIFSEWRIFAEAVAGTPALEIVSRAHEWSADLVVVGSHGRSALGRLILGSVSHRVVNECRSSVRVARIREPFPDTHRPPHLVIGFDGSAHSQQAVRAVANRTWPAGTRAHIVMAQKGADIIRVTDTPLATDVATDRNEGEATTKLRISIEEAIKTLNATTHLEVELRAIERDPKQALIRAAEEFDADCIFVGSRGESRGLFQKLLLGSVSTAVVNDAHCSVEVVHPMTKGVKV